MLGMLYCVQIYYICVDCLCQFFVNCLNDAFVFCTGRIKKKTFRIPMSAVKLGSYHARANVAE